MAPVVEKRSEKREEEVRSEKENMMSKGKVRVRVRGRVKVEIKVRLVRIDRLGQLDRCDMWLSFISR